MKILVLGANGMIGSAMLRVLSEKDEWQVIGTVRSESAKAHFPETIASRMIAGADLLAADTLVRLFSTTRPDVVVNCAGLTKHLPAGNAPLTAIAMNALLPHRLAEFCRISAARLIHVSTDCVFAGTRGAYKECDVADAPDIYGRSKVLGEVVGPGQVTLRTSTIGHELGTRHGLLEWFLSQSRCQGFTRAIFSGLPSTVFARVVRDIIIPDIRLSGLYHVAGRAIAKADLLRQVAQTYRADIEIIPEDQFVIDRSLDATLFAGATGYRAPPWPELIAMMHDDFEKGFNPNV
jgi:dTDP-4-dehydrorhamnose reductase